MAKPKGFASIGIAGASDVVRALEELPNEIDQRVMRRTFARAFTHTLEAARTYAREVADSGATEKALLLTVQTDKRTGRTTARVGVDKDAVFLVTIQTATGTRRVRRRPCRYMHLLEKGTQPHRLGAGVERRKALKYAALEKAGRAGGLHPGTRPQPILRPALDTTEAAVMRTVEIEFEKGLTLAVKRLRKRQARKG